MKNKLIFLACAVTSLRVEIIRSNGVGISRKERVAVYHGSISDAKCRRYFEQILKTEKELKESDKTTLWIQNMLMLQIAEFEKLILNVCPYYKDPVASEAQN